MTAALFAGALIAIIWSAIKYQIAYGKVADKLPKRLNARLAFPAYALSASTPLSLQAEYVKALSGGCVASLLVSLCFFSMQERAVGIVCLIVFAASVVSAHRAWRTYRCNCHSVAAKRAGMTQETIPGS